MSVFIAPDPGSEPQVRAAAYDGQVRPVAADVALMADDLPDLHRVDATQRPLGVHILGAPPTRSRAREESALVGGHGRQPAPGGVIVPGPVGAMRKAVQQGPPAIGLITGLFLVGFAGIRIFPVVGFSLLFFLLNHLIESSVIALEILFEHRNYLPSMFLFLPVAMGVR